MGVYIKGMEMPTSCAECPLYTFPPSLFDELDALSIKTGVSKSEMVREATWEYVYKHTAEEGE